MFGGKIMTLLKKINMLFVVCLMYEGSDGHREVKGCDIEIWDHKEHGVMPIQPPCMAGKITWNVPKGALRIHLGLSQLPIELENPANTFADICFKAGVKAAHLLLSVEDSEQKRTSSLRHKNLLNERSHGTEKSSRQICLRTADSLVLFAQIVPEFITSLYGKVRLDYDVREREDNEGK
ncbi:DgyrCDS7098 [Dimorphilus gyrociliatus]|uniref:DgyrCDS7098 n=1 Tax=Dimorphilus gyrociliatus TaxID=2664684 RepID=A0A7I8VQ81_9ANNE|nr:DgyrCDS7098 [Dimorphilus gyrociliatus]